MLVRRTLKISTYALVVSITPVDALEIRECRDDRRIGKTPDRIDDGKRVSLVFELLVLTGEQYGGKTERGQRDDYRGGCEDLLCAHRRFYKPIRRASTSR